jgi:hypothetical protein
MIEKVSYGPYIELFARRPAEGWDVWGNEVESTIALPVSKPVTDEQEEAKFVGVTTPPYENPPSNVEPGRATNFGTCKTCGKVTIGGRCILGNHN